MSTQNKKKFPLLILAVLFVAVGLFQQASATPYGRNLYGTCTYGCASPPGDTTTPPSQPPTQTVTPTPSGLDVAINLTDGQQIPEGGYTIIITPLNGAGNSFQQVEIIINGIVVFIGTPAPDGTIRWVWDAELNPNAIVQINITDQTGAVTTKTFNVSVVSRDSIVPTTTGTESDDTGGNGGFAQRTLESIGSLFTGAVNTATELVRALPAPVVYGFPYFLLLLLAINVILIVIQAFREVKEYNVLKALVARGQSVAEAKKTLAQLVSHYLRTPLTLMMGGADMLKQDPNLQTAVARLEPLLTRLHLKIEGLISQTIDTSTVKIESIATANKQAGVLMQPGLLVPLILIPLVIVPFNFLVARAGTFSVSQISLAAQILAFGILIGSLYVVLRYTQLRSRDAETLSEIMKEEEAVQTSRDQLISQTATAIEEEVGGIDQIVSEMQGNPSLEFVVNGESRLKDMLSKLRVATRLKGAHSESQFVETSLAALAGGAVVSLQPKAGEKHVTISPVADTPLQVRSPELVSFMIQNIVDNAIAYSHEKGIVDVTLHEDSSTYEIAVTDHGSGIAKDEMALLFQPFSKAEGAEVFTHEGMGFSLYLDTLVASYVGGKITIESQPDIATTVRIFLPKISQTA